MSNEEFAHALGRAVHRPAFVPTPLTPLRLVYGRELVENLLLGGQRVLPEVLEGSGFVFEYPTLDDALRHELARAPQERDSRIGVTEGFRTPDLRDHNPAL